MSDQPEREGLSDRQERIITAAFVIVGALFLLLAIYSTAGQLEAVQAAIDAAEDTPPSRVVLQELNQEILAGFIGVILLASGVLRWHE